MKIAFYLTLFLTASVSAGYAGGNLDFGQEYMQLYSAAFYDEPIMILVSNTGNRDHVAFLGSPQDRSENIKNLFNEAGQRIRKLRDELDAVIDKIVTNERRINNTTNPQERQRLVRENIGLLDELEDVRLRIANVQMETAQKIFDIERNAYQQITSDVTRRKQQIRTNPSRYWLWRRNHLLEYELQGTLSDEQISELYRR